LVHELRVDRDPNGGTCTIWFRSPGTYTVSVEGATAPAQTAVVAEGEIVTGVDFAIAP
jgi:hypothetical protein